MTSLKIRTETFRVEGWSGQTAFLSNLLESAGEELSPDGIQSIDEEDPVEMVNLVLDRPGEQSLRLEFHRFPVSIHSTDPEPVVPGHFLA